LASLRWPWRTGFYRGRVEEKERIGKTRRIE